MRPSSIRGRLVWGLIVALFGASAARARAGGCDDSCCDDGPPLKLARYVEPQWPHDLAREPSNAYLPVLNLLDSPNALGQGQWFAGLGGEFLRDDSDRTTDQYIGSVGGMYGITNQLAVGGYFPFVEYLNSAGGDFPTTSNGNTSYTGIGDLYLNGQYDLTSLAGLNARRWDVSANLGFSVPTGSATKGTGLGHVVVQPTISAFHTLRHFGSGALGVYAEGGFDISRNSGVRGGLGVSYGIDKFVLTAETLLTTSGGNRNVTYAPGLAYMGFEHWLLEAGIPIGYDHNTVGAKVNVTYLH